MVERRWNDGITPLADRCDCVENVHPRRRIYPHRTSFQRQCANLLTRRCPLQSDGYSTAPVNCTCFFVYIQNTGNALPRDYYVFSLEQQLCYSRRFVILFIIKKNILCFVYATVHHLDNGLAIVRRVLHTD